MMTHRAALEVVAHHRGGRLVIATMGSVEVWPTLADGPLDFCYLPSSMGQGVPLGLGLALARPGLGVVVLTGDGSLLMNLGCLVTIAAHPTDLAVVLIHNGLYEVTGGQPTAGRGGVDYAGVARAAGIGRVAHFHDLTDWEAQGAAVLGGAGPSFVCLEVEGTTGKKTPTAPRTMPEQIARLRHELGTQGPPRDI